MGGWIATGGFSSRFVGLRKVFQVQKILGASRRLLIPNEMFA
jgi:hypothetical protein